MKWASDLKTKVIEALEFVRRRKASYQRTFLSPTGQDCLTDLAKFCRANASCFDADPRVHAVLEGRREVWLRIQQHLNLTSEQLFQIFSGKQIQVVTANDDDGI